MVLKRFTFLSHPLVLFTTASLVAFFPCLFLGQTYFDDDLINLHGIYFSFLKAHLQLGHLPFWNPYVFAGQPFMADPTTLSLYPFLYPFLVFPMPLGLNAFLAFHFILAALGMSYWLGKLNLSKSAQIWGGFTFAFSGFFWCELIHPNVIAAIAWFPWLLGRLENTIRDPKPLNAFILGLTGAIFVSSLYPQILLGGAYAALIYYVFSIINSGKPKEKLKNLPSLIPYLLAGLAPALLAILPFAEFMRFSDRMNPLDYKTFNSGLSLPPPMVVQFLFPVTATYPGPADSGIPIDYWADEGFLGFWALILACLSFSREKKWLKIGLALTAFLFFLLALGQYFPLHPWACRWLPGFHLLRGPFRFLFVFATALPALGAMGWDRLWNHNLRRQSLGLIGLSTSVVLGTFLWWSPPHWLEGIQPWLFLLGALCLVSGLWNNQYKTWAQILFIIFAFSSLLLSGWSHASSRLGPGSNLDFRKETGFFEKLNRQVGPARLFLGDHIPYEVEWGGLKTRLDLPSNISSLFDVDNAGGNNILSLSTRGDLYTLPFGTFSKLLAIQGFATGNEKGQVPGYTRQEWEGVKFYRSAQRRDWVYAPSRIQVIPDPQQRLRTMREPGFDPYQEAVLSEPINPEWAGPSAGKNDFQYAWVEKGINQNIFKTRLVQARWVVFSDPNYPGWNAWVDESPAAIVTTNHFFRGLRIPEGEHQVKFTYQPTWFRLGAFIFLVWSVFVVATVNFYPRRSGI